MVRLLTLLSCGVLASCTFGVATCQEDADCGAIGQCVQGFCTLRDAGGDPDGGSDDAGSADAGPSDGGGGDAGATSFCAPTLACADYEECSPTPDGGLCSSQDLLITWVSPSAGVESSQGRLAAALLVTRRDGGTAALTALPVDGGVSDFVRSGASFVGELALSGADGPRVFVAGWPAPGPNASLEVIRDTSPPQVAVFVEPRPLAADPDPVVATAWKKDEQAVVRVEVAGGRAPLASDVVPRWGGAVAPVACLTSCAGNCSCFGLDLSRAEVRGMRGEDTFVVQAIADSAGNTSVPVDAGVQVSRFKWRRSMSLASGSSPLLPIAVSGQGLVVWGGYDAPSSSPRVLGTAADGGTRWTIGSAEVTAGPVVGNDSLWLGTVEGTTSQLQRFSLASGAGTGTDCIALATTFGAFAGDLTLGAPNSAAPRPYGVRTGAVQFPTTLGCGTQALTGFPTSSGSRPTLVARDLDAGTVELFSASTAASRLWKVEASGDTASSRGDVQLPATTQPRGLFFDGVQRAGGGGVVSGGTVFTTLAAGSLTGATLESVPAANAGPVAVGSGFMLYGTSDGRIQRLSYDSATGQMSDGGTATVLSGAGPVSLQERTPVLGAGGLAYFLGDDGYLSVRRSADLGEVWAAPLISGASMTAQPALDAYRGASDVKDCSVPLGVLYVLSKVGSVAHLTAVLVDSQGLEPTAPWPRFQRDNGNTGNAGTSLSPWTCP